MMHLCSKIKYKLNSIAASEDSFISHERATILSTDSGTTYSTESAVISADTIDIGNGMYTVHQNNVAIGGKDNQIPNGYRNSILGGEGNKLYGQHSVSLSGADNTTGSSFALTIGGENNFNDKYKAIVIASDDVKTGRNALYIAAEESDSYHEGIVIGDESDLIQIGDQKFPSSTDMDIAA